MLKKTQDLALSALILMSFAVLWREVLTLEANRNPMFDYGVGPVFFPKVLLVIWAILGIAIGLRAFAHGDVRAELHRYRRLAAGVAATALYLLSIPVLGFLLSSMIFGSLFPRLLGFGSTVWALIIGVLFSAAAWVVFTKFLGIVLPAGIVIPGM